MIQANELNDKAMIKTIKGIKGYMILIGDSSECDEWVVER
jgi:hypothetical protein